MNTNLSDPARTVARLIEALNHADLEAAVNLYEADAVFFPEPGRAVTGRDAVRAALAELLALQPKLSASGYRVVQTETTALYCSRWTMHGSASDGSSIRLGGVSSDVLHRQDDGRWLIAIDNPFGAAILEAEK